MGEIDDIFAGKSKAKGKAKEVEPSAPEPAPLPKKKKKKKSKKIVMEEELVKEEPPAPVAGTKRKLPETVVDPSLAVEAQAKKSKSGKKEGKKAEGQRQENSDDERFRDSRGTGPSECLFIPGCVSRTDLFDKGRRTEEGFAIYKEDELGISNEGGGQFICCVYPIFD